MNEERNQVDGGPRCRGILVFWAVLCLALAALSCPVSALANGPAWLLDMTHANPGSGYPASRFASPQFLAEWGYNGQVVGSFGGIQTFDALVPGLLPEGSPEREWALQRELNAYVVAKFAENPSRSEEALFNEFARERLGLKGESGVNRYHRVLDSNPIAKP